jgi:hypothetical protein
MRDLWTQYALDFLMVDLLFAHWLSLLFLFASTSPFILSSLGVRTYCPHSLKSRGPRHGERRSVSVGGRREGSDANPSRRAPRSCARPASGPPAEANASAILSPSVALASSHGMGNEMCTVYQPRGSPQVLMIRPVSAKLGTVDDGVAPATSVPEPDMKVVPSSGSSEYGQLRLIPAFVRSA